MTAKEKVLKVWPDAFMAWLEEDSMACFVMNKPAGERISEYCSNEDTEAAWQKAAESLPASEAKVEVRPEDFYPKVSHMNPAMPAVWGKDLVESLPVEAKEADPCKMTDAQYEEYIYGPPEPKPTPSTPDGYRSRSHRQRVVGNWCVEAFGEQEGTYLPQRGIRLLEEAAEAAQSAGVDLAMAEEMMRYVWSRPAGALFQEIGGVGVTTLALAQAALLEADECEAIEVERVLSKPLEHFTKRNQVKNDAGFLAKPQPDSSSIDLKPWLDRAVDLLNLYHSGYCPKDVAKDFLDKCKENFGDVTEYKPFVDSSSLKAAAKGSK